MLHFPAQLSKKVLALDLGWAAGRNKTCKLERGQEQALKLNKVYPHFHILKVFTFSKANQTPHTKVENSLTLKKETG